MSEAAELWEKVLLRFLWPMCVCCVGGLEKWAGRDSRLPVEDLDGYLRMNGLFRLIFYRESCSQARQNKGSSK
jgi:hypothetical protein